MKEKAVPKLPMWATVREAYKFALGNFGEYFRISRWWLLVAIVASYFYNWFTWKYAKPSFCKLLGTEIQASEINSQHMDLFMQSLPGMILALIAGASIGVAWLRFILRNEKIAQKPYFRFAEAEWSYFVLTALFMLPVVAVNVASALLMQGGHLVFELLILSSLLAGVFIVMRLGLLRCVKALGVDVTVGEVWRKTNGNFWKLFVGAWLCTALSMIWGAVTMPVACANESMAVPLYSITQYAYLIIGAPVEMVFWALTYRHFFEREASGNDFAEDERSSAP